MIRDFALLIKSLERCTWLNKITVAIFIHVCHHQPCRNTFSELQLQVLMTVGR